ncbi:putative NRPS-like enzyme [Xylariaceae sp. FL0255]|nr:putative NRPS-like enzyme [Xylariaceae sp. FL0255]
MADTNPTTARWKSDLLPHIVDRVARDSPNAAYGLWTISPTSYDEGYRTITYSQVANVVNGLAHWLSGHLGPGQGEVIAYLGPNDVRLTALLLAAIKTNYVLFFPSPRNSAAAQKGLLDTLKCKTLITPSPISPPAQTILGAAQVQLLAIPEVDQLLGETYEHYTCNRTYEKNGREPIWAIHTSGSTGFPKPIIWTSEAMSRHHNGTDVAPPQGERSLDHFERGKRVLTFLPPFHGAGLGQYLFWGIPFGTTPIAPLPTAIPTAQGVVEALKQTPADVVLLVPSMVAEFAADPVSLDYVAANVKLLVYLGGDCPKSVGDIVAAKIPLRCQWGCSELGFAHQLWPTELGPQDWKYIRLHPSTGGVFEETVDGAYELVFKREDPLLENQSLWSISGQEHLDEYRTRDLFEPHPTVPDAWSWRARTDDIIVFLNGEKTNPVTMEQSIVTSNPELTNAIVIGTQRFQAALLVQPASTVNIATTADQAALIERIWPSVEEANSITPAHARVEKSMILIATPDRPVLVSPKGTIQRSASQAQYSAELDKLYADADVEVDFSHEIYSPLGSNVLRRRIRDVVTEITGWHEISDSTDFFESSMDSLQALRTIRALRHSLGVGNLALSTLYHNASIERLTAAIISHKNVRDDGDLMQSLFSTYSGLIEQIKPASVGNTGASSNGTGAINVVLTGSTGTVGTYILHALLNRAGIGHIFCLNRGTDGGRSAQVARFEAAGLMKVKLDDRVTFLHSDLAQPSLGLDEAVYQEIQSRASLIIHNAWPVNFNLDLLAFRPQLAGLVNLFALSNAATLSLGKPMTFLFISSVGVVLDAGPGPAPETLVELRQHDAGNGYSKSKLLAEHLCECAARHLAAPVLIARVGQVAGAVRNKGLWNPAEWLPSLVMSSRYLGCLPDSLGPQFSTVDWVPVDALADVIVDLITHHEASEIGTSVFNIRNPAVVSWGDVLASVKEGIEAETSRTVEVVSPETWIAQLEKSVEVSGQDDGAHVAASVNPAIKLIEFYKNSVWKTNGEYSSALAPMAVEKSVAASPMLRHLPSVSPSWMRQWVNEWLAAAAAGPKNG